MKSFIKTIFFSISLLILPSCLGMHYSKYDVIEKEVFLGYRDELNTKYDFILDEGLYYKNDRYDKRFTCALYGPLWVENVEQARAVAIECMEKLVNRINSLESIRDSLHHYPILRKEITLQIEFDERKPLFFTRKPAHFPYVCEVFIKNDRIRYSKSNPEYTDKVELYTEPYETAYQIVHETEY